MQNMKILGQFMDFWMKYNQQKIMFSRYMHNHVCISIKLGNLSCGK
jgi:hypothetical protein